MQYYKHQTSHREATRDGTKIDSSCQYSLLIHSFCYVFFIFQQENYPTLSWEQQEFGQHELSCQMQRCLSVAKYRPGSVCICLFALLISSIHHSGVSTFCSWQGFSHKYSNIIYFVIIFQKIQNGYFGLWFNTTQYLHNRSDNST